MMDQVQFEVSGFRDIPGDEFDGDPTLVHVLKALTGPLRLMASVFWQMSSNAGGTNGLKLPFHLWSQA